MLHIWYNEKKRQENKHASKTAETCAPSSIDGSKSFKQLFGSEKNKEITVIFLNAVLQRNEHHRIKEISFANVEKTANYEEDKVKLASEVVFL
ncbi:PD-(D/E)XK nuclease family transposase [Salicibibacter cibi]|uniref:PD-(D/E)XK nuclease family transposase n=1 Tax=Salicibibacter cibi TaxID=2743001 RepID=A0A7T7CE95_9BACI|nr:PD-(D/E)XK nuclease family transposase [Salicibibacter cibi]